MDEESFKRDQWCYIFTIQVFPRNRFYTCDTQTSCFLDDIVITDIYSMNVNPTFPLYTLNDYLYSSYSLDAAVLTSNLKAEKHLKCESRVNFPYMTLDIMCFYYGTFTHCNVGVETVYCAALAYM